MFLTELLLLAAGKLAALSIRRRMVAFEAATRQPERTQEALLHRILGHQAATDFGRDHHFAGIRTVGDFRRHLPVSPYEYFEPYLARVRRGEFRALLADDEVHMFALTSGTTAARKYIPVTPQYLADYRRGWNMWGLRAYDDHPEVKLRPILQLSGDWDEFRTEANIPCGAVTGLTAVMQKRIVHWLYCVPACVGKVKDARSKYYVALRLSLPRRVGMIIAANPSTLVNLARAADAEKEALIRDLRDGGLSAHLNIPEEVRRALEPALRKRRPERARELEAIVQRTGTLYPRDCWPSDLLLGNWTGGSMGAYLRHYPRYYGYAPVRDIGLIASEGRMTIPVADGTASGVLDVTTHFFEFIPEEEAESKQPTVLAAHELQQGRSYFILPTTAFGLYRYHIRDLVRVTGFYNKTPMLEFLSKGSYFSNLTGEKLSEYHVTRAMTHSLTTLDLSLTSYSLAPCWDDEQPYYGLFVERGDLLHPEQGTRLTELLDRTLGRENIEYASKRESLRLGPVRLELLPDGAWSQWDRQRLAKQGGTLEQYKHPCLINDLKFRDGIQAAVDGRCIGNGQS
jgi:hypothetical protein